MSNSTEVLVRLLDGPHTRQELGITHYTMVRLLEDELVSNKRVVQTGRRGRPAYLLALTPKGRGRARRAAAKVAIAA